VAARAGVALSSVSRVLSGHADVSAKMRIRVEEAAHTLGYEPDLLAQSMRSGATRTIGFIITDIANPMFALVARSCEQELRRAGYSMILMNSDGEAETEAENFAVMRRRHVDGIIASLISEKSASVNASINSLRAPLVLLDREIAGMKMGAVNGDHRKGVHDAVEELLARGHRKIAFITGGLDVFITRDRLKGFRDAFAEVMVPVPEESVALGGFDEEFSSRETHRLFSKKTRPTALLTGGVGATAGALRALKKLEIEPGKDIAFVAIDEWPMFDVFASQFSSVFRDPHVIGRESARIMLEVLSGAEPRTAVVETKFISRASSAGGV
jgi:LacI family transcriptional regulator